MDHPDLVESSSRGLRHAEEALERYFVLAKRRAEQWGDGYLKLWNVIEQNTSGGKRFRPRMVMTAYVSLGGDDLPAAGQLAAAYEMLHTALIVHDDVIDRDFVRRGIPNVSGSYRDQATTAGFATPAAEHRGMSVAVIAGDLALSGAYGLVDRTGADDVTRLRLRDLLDGAVSASAAGELADVDFSLRPEAPTVDEVVDMERLKTAVYSFEAPLQSVAVLAGADDATVTALGEFGRLIGIAYQIVDDVLGVFGDPRATGKSTIGDLREGKRTVLVSYASTRDEWMRVRGLFGSPALEEDGAEQIRAVLEECGARTYTEALARDYANRAWEALTSPSIPDATRDELRPIVANVLERAR
jgi:geranylgeranyl diphosphate synthase type II